MIVAVPAVTPAVTVPPALTLAIVVALLLHVPPDVASVSALVALTHALRVPPIAAGNGFTVTVVVAIHPVVGNV